MLKCVLHSDIITNSIFSLLNTCASVRDIRNASTTWMRSCVSEGALQPSLPAAVTLHPDFILCLSLVSFVLVPHYCFCRVWIELNGDISCRRLSPGPHLLMKPGLPYAYKPANAQKEHELQPGITVLLVWLEVFRWKRILIASGKRYDMGNRKKAACAPIRGCSSLPQPAFQKSCWQRWCNSPHSKCWECVRAGKGWEE